MENHILFNAYLQKQRNFISFVKDIQVSIKSKEFQKQGYSLSQYSKMKWNISQAQTYRFLICAKVIDQLEEFDIKPSYESLCKSLNQCAKSKIKMKLLWSKILQKTNNRPDCINSTHVNQYWKELCMDKKYSTICHYKDEKDIMVKIENSLNKLANQKKHKQMNQNEQDQKKQDQNKLNQKINNSKITSYPSPTLSESSIISNDTQFSLINSEVNYNNNTIYNSLSPIHDINNSGSISCNDSLYNNTSYIQCIPYTTTTVSLPSNQIFYNLPNENELSNQYQQQLTQVTNQYQQQLTQVTYLQEQPQNQYIYY